MSMISWAELQLSIMDVLWNQESATVHELIMALSDERPPAYTTVLTVLTNLVKQGFVGHDLKPGTRMYAYYALVTQEEIRTHLAEEMMARLFDDSAAIMVKLLLKTQTFSPKQLKEIAQMVRDNIKKEARLPPAS